MNERRYTDEEVARLLQRAADLDRDSGATTLARGLSLAELREVAAEAGIDPGMVSSGLAQVGVAGGAAVAGWGLGRAIWSFLRGRSRRRVEDLVERLGDEAARLSNPSLS